MAKRKVTSFDEYADLVSRSGIVEKEKLHKIIKELEEHSGAKPTESVILARKLQDDNLVTAWQNRHLLSGRSKGFFLGKYKLLDFISTGGMSTVYLAEHVMMRRRVAIKVLFETGVDATTLERFRRECQMVGSLDHPNIVRAHDFDSDGKFHYLAMEYVDGPNLQTLIEKRGQMGISTAANYIQQAALGLHHAHEAGLVHRDIKPSNLLLNSKGVIKVLDLGVARLTTIDDSLTLASNQTLLGTLDYLSPEQAMNSHSVDRRADIYSLGCTLYFLLVGHPPFPDGHQTQKLLAHQMQQPEKLVKLRNDVPGEIQYICEKMMSKKADDRSQTMEEVADALAPWSDAEAPKPSDSILSLRPKLAPMTGETSSNAEGGTVSEEREVVKVKCTNCHQIYQVPVRATKRRAKCPKCNATIFIPPPDEITKE